MSNGNEESVIRWGWGVSPLRSDPSHGFAVGPEVTITIPSEMTFLLDDETVLDANGDFIID